MLVQWLIYAERLGSDGSGGNGVGAGGGSAESTGPEWLDGSEDGVGSAWGSVGNAAGVSGEGGAGSASMRGTAVGTVRPAAIIIHSMSKPSLRTRWS